MRAGDLILAGEIPRVLWAYEHAGRGTAGWVAAERTLRERVRFSPTPVTEQAIQAVLGHARGVVQTGHNYRQAGANYVPNIANVPDLRRLEERAQHPPEVGPSGRRESRYWNHGIVEVRDPNANGRIVQSYSVTVPSDGILSRNDLEALLAERGVPFFERFINYQTVDQPRYQFTYEIRIGGTYRGY